jgi:hypothetical protein
MSFNQLRRSANLQVAAQERAHRMQVAIASRRAIAEGSEMAPTGGGRSRVSSCRPNSSRQDPAVLSAALFLEAYIFDYCARRVEDIRRQVLDRLDPAWVVVPRLIVVGLDKGLRSLSGSASCFDYETNSYTTRPRLRRREPVPMTCNRLTAFAAMRHSPGLRPRPHDDFGAFVLRHVSSWAQYSQGSTFLSDTLGGLTRR